MTVSSVEAVQVRLTESGSAEARRSVGRSGGFSPVASLVEVISCPWAWTVRTKVNARTRAQMPRPVRREEGRAAMALSLEGQNWGGGGYAGAQDAQYRRAHGGRVGGELLTFHSCRYAPEAGPAPKDAAHAPVLTMDKS